MTKCIVLFFFLTCFLFSKAQSPIDVLQYRFQLTLSDASDSIKGTAVITAKVLQNTDCIYLNLASIKEGKGMLVYRVASGNTTFSNTHVHNTLFIQLPAVLKTDSIKTFTITYGGIPADGLIISKNKWGDRTFFADNWPDRAHQWIPCNDRPDDKAAVAFEVTAPAHYSIISNGKLVEETALQNQLKRTRWSEETPISTKVMVIGAARFSVKQYGDSNTSVPVSAWVYPQDSAKGFYDYGLAPSIVQFFSNYIGPYPFSKLANVQSKTIFGGMENAGAIFYGEATVTGDRTSEGLLAHEIAHQWFGNSATEKRFAHVWLSEGFATYMTLVYLEQKYGRDTLVKSLKRNRNEIIQFIKAQQWHQPVVDSVSAGMDLLNANSYQKGGWVLHMLRLQVGDSVFKTIIQTYYNQYKYGNADTWAFEKVAEEISGTDLKQFFRQWLYTPGIPQLVVQWQWTSGQLQVWTAQQQQPAFPIPLTIEVQTGNERGKQLQINLTKAIETFTFSIAKKPVRIVLDPGTGLLFDGKISERK